jgi:hypothetical protein
MKSLTVKGMFTEYRIRKFWSWFKNNHFKLNQNDEHLFELSIKLKKIHSGLTFEIKFSNNLNILIISADGNKNLFELVTKIINQAPEINNWKTIAFRQPKDFSTVEIDDTKLFIDDVFAKYYISDSKVNIDLFVKNYIESSNMTACIFVLLDNLFGEYFVETKIQNITVSALEDFDNESNIITIKNLQQDLFIDLEK